MRCAAVEPQVTALADGELKGWTAWRVRRHLARCEACSAWAHKVDQHVAWQRELLAAISVPDDRLDVDSLRRRTRIAIAAESVAMAIRQEAPPATFRWKPAMAVAAFAALLAVLSVTGGMRAALVALGVLEDPTTVAREAGDETESRRR